MSDNKYFTFYHGTSKENWNKIQEEGVLWGRRFVELKKGVITEIDRCTYLATTKEEAEHYGDIVLEVYYNPLLDKDNNNYHPNSWQLRVYCPISIENIKRIK